MVLYYNIIILWDHRRICVPSLTETSLCCKPVLYTVKSLHNLLITCFYFVYSDSNHCQTYKCSLSIIVILNKPKDTGAPFLPWNVVCAAYLTIALSYKLLRYRYIMCSCHPLRSRGT